MINWIKWNRGKFLAIVLISLTLIISAFFANKILLSNKELTGLGRSLEIEKCLSIKCVSDVVNETSSDDYIEVLNEVKNINTIISNQPNEIANAGGLCKIVGELVGYKIGSSGDIDSLDKYIKLLNLEPSKALDNNRYMCQSSFARGLTKQIASNNNVDTISSSLINICPKVNKVGGEFSYLFDFKNIFCGYMILGSVVSNTYIENDMQNWVDIVEICNKTSDGLQQVCLKGALANLILSNGSMKLGDNDCNNFIEVSYCSVLRSEAATLLLEKEFTSNTYNESDFVNKICKDDQEICIQGIYNAAFALGGGPSVCSEKFKDIEGCLKTGFTKFVLEFLNFNTLRGEDLINALCVDPFREICRPILDNILSYRYKTGLV
jgi:hypothetical protein